MVESTSDFIQYYSAVFNNAGIKNIRFILTKQLGVKIIRVPPDFPHPKDSKGGFIPGAHLELLYSLPTEYVTHVYDIQ